MTGKVIRAEQLTKVYKGDLGRKPITALDDLDLDVVEGETYAFLGPNGAGKTTAIKLLTRLLHPTHGRIWIFDRPNTDPKSMASVGYLPEQPNLYAYLTGIEFLQFIARLFKLDARTRKQRIADLLERVGLHDQGNRLIKTYSRGMLQRLGMAQALVNDPQLLILDEPMSALDPIGRKELRDLILELKRRGKTVFFSSHILSDAEIVADRVAILKGGRLISSGKLDQLVGSQAASIEVTFAVAADQAPLSEWGIDGAVVQGRNAMVRLAREEDLPGLLRKVDERRGKLVSVIPVKKSLEDLFLSEIGR